MSTRGQRWRARPVEATLTAMSEKLDTPAGPREGDISAAERQDILAQIEERVARSRRPMPADDGSYRAARSGAWLPLVVNLVALIMVLAGLVAIPALFARRDATAAAPRLVASSGEASLVGAVKQEGERQLEQLRSSRDAELAAERERLAKSGASAASVDERLRAFSARLDAEIAGREAAYVALAAQGERESLALDQLTAAWGPVADAMAAERWTDARARLGSVRALLGEPSVAGLPAIQRRSAVDAFLLDSLEELVEYESGAGAAATEAAMVASDAAASAAAQEAAATRDELARRDRTIAGLQAAEKARQEAGKKASDSLEARLGVLEAALGAAARRGATSGEGARQELIALLQAKVTAKEVLTSEPARSAHPGLSASLDRYIELSVEQGRTAGRAAALADVSAIADFLLGRKTQADLAQIWARSADDAQRAALKQVLDRLEALAR